MGRPGFVLDVDDRTPPLVVSDGTGIRLERFPLGTRVVYAPEPMAPLADVNEAINAALDAPLDSAPLSERLRPGMRLTIAFDDNTRPLPRMRRPDIRGRVIEAVLSRAAAAGVDDVALICANGLNRRLTADELEHLLGERVFRSFYAEGLLTNHDAEDTDGLSTIGSAYAGEVRLNSRAAESDLLVYVHVVVTPRGGGAAQVASGLGSAATISQLAGLDALATGGQATAAVGAVVEQAVPIFDIEAVLDNDTYAGAVNFLGRREWEWSLRERAASLALRRALEATRPRARRRLVNSVVGGYQPIAIFAGAPTPVQEASRAQLVQQQRVQVKGQADVGIVGVPQTSPYSVDSITNPVLAAWLGLAATLHSHTQIPVVRQGGAVILYHALTPEFSPLHHPAYVDFFSDVLTSTTDPQQLKNDFETKFATDPWYIQLYRTSYAFHGLHPFHLWYQIAAVREQYADIVWVGGDRPTADRMGFRAASTLADALEIVTSSVGRSPAITYLHTPPQLVADVVR